jgi:Cysteine-rich secretory protein family
VRTRFALGLLLACVSGIAACKKEDPPPSYPPSALPPSSAPYVVPASAPAPAPAPAPTAAPAPPAGTAAVGLPCASDQDLQCVFAHCVANRCGGCSSSSACKPGSQCVPSWLGYACFPGAAPAPPAAPTPVTPSPAPANASGLDALRARCVQRTNEFRAGARAAPLVRRPDREACSDAQAQSDGATGSAHGAFGRCQESAQNECPGWPGPLDQAIDKCLAQMFAEGPGTFTGHGHYLNMTEPTYRGVACGISALSNGQFWIVQDFYR